MRRTSLTAEHFPHIAIQSRFSGRKNDHLTEMTKTSADAAMGGPQLTLYRPDGHLRSMEGWRPTSSASPSAITAAA